MAEEEDLDAQIAAQTAQLIAEMERTIQRTRIMVLDRKGLDPIAEEKPEGN